MEVLLEEAVADVGVTEGIDATGGTVVCHAFPKDVSILDTERLDRNGFEVLVANHDAAAVDADSLTAFLELIAAADADYMNAPEPSGKVEAGFEWEDVQRMLSESQYLLVAMQRMLSLILEEMAIADHEHIRVYADAGNCLRLVSPHPDCEAIEAELNRPERIELRNLYHAAMAGLRLAGSLVGNSVSPTQVMARVKAGFHAA